MNLYRVTLDVAHIEPIGDGEDAEASVAQDYVIVGTRCRTWRSFRNHGPTGRGCGSVRRRRDRVPSARRKGSSEKELHLWRSDDYATIKELQHDMARAELEAADSEGSPRRWATRVPLKRRP